MPGDASYGIMQKNGQSSWPDLLSKNGATSCDFGCPSPILLTAEELQHWLDHSIAERERGPLKSRKGPAARVSSRALSDPDTKRFVIGDVRSARVGIGNWRALLQLVSSPCQISSCSTVCPPTNIHRGPKKSEPLLTHQFNHRFVPDFATKTALQNQSTKPRFIG